jgi:predicted short-subunit dehydrogenase-like oxidoreductase (DUF2520 family)
MDNYNISFVGAGRVADSLCRRLHISGSKIDKIVSRNEIAGKALASTCNAEWSNELLFHDSSGIIIVAVPDHSLKQVLSGIKCGKETIVAHTAGSLGLDIFPPAISLKAVFYPLQTFSLNREIDFRNLPFFIESPHHYVNERLKSLAESTGGKVYFADTEKRRLIHLAAVFICNFTNHMLTLGIEIAAKGGFEKEIFKPLLEETVAKAMEIGPIASQTGPAVRNDLNVIEKHLDLLSFSPEYRKIYSDVTESIIRYYNKGDR